MHSVSACSRDDVSVTLDFSWRQNYPWKSQARRMRDTGIVIELWWRNWLHHTIRCISKWHGVWNQPVLSTESTIFDESDAPLFFRSSCCLVIGFAFSWIHESDFMKWHEVSGCHFRKSLHYVIVSFILTHLIILRNNFRRERLSYL